MYNLVKINDRGWLLTTNLLAKNDLASISSVPSPQFSRRSLLCHVDCLECQHGRMRKEERTEGEEYIQRP